VDNKERLKLWVLNNPDKVKQYRLNYKNSKAKRIRLEREHEKIKEYDKIYIAKKRKEDPLFRMLSNIRSRTSHEFRKISSSKNSTTINLLGINQDILKKYIERKFTKGMNWNNYGEWHIDHIIPLSSAENKSDLKKLMHYTNLQPLWAFDNMSKGSDQVEHQ